jgi:hypothetical protein
MCIVLYNTKTFQTMFSSELETLFTFAQILFEIKFNFCFHSLELSCPHLNFKQGLTKKQFFVVISLLISDCFVLGLP